MVLVGEGVKIVILRFEGRLQKNVLWFCVGRCRQCLPTFVGRCRSLHCRLPTNVGCVGRACLHLLTSKLKIEKPKIFIQNYILIFIGCRGNVFSAFGKN